MKPVRGSTTIRRTRLPLAFSALLGVGRYESLPIRTPAALIGQRVKVSLTDSGSVVLAPKVGQSVEVIEGSLLADSLGSCVIAVAVTRLRGGSERDWRGERVVAAHALVSSFAQRSLSRSRSTFASALMTAGVVAITVGLQGGGGSSGGVPGPGKAPSQ